MDHFKHCLNCGDTHFTILSGKQFQCSSCGFVYFQNVATTACAVIKVGDEVLMTQRARDPAKGLFDFPGGFVDPGESAESALMRELKEELCFDVEALDSSYLMSVHNVYQYGGVDYQTCDLLFLLECSKKPAFTVADDVADIAWFHVEEIKREQCAFECVYEVVRRLQKMS